MYCKKKNYTLLSRSKLIVWLIVSIGWMTGAGAQPVNDTTAIINDFNKVMSFATAPFLYYATTTKMNSWPVLEERDTMSVKGVFYKKGTELYYFNDLEETFLQDSLLIQINNDRKTIWVSRVDAETRDKLSTSLLDNKKIRELFRKSFRITRTITSANNVLLDFEQKQGLEDKSSVTTIISLEYDAGNYHPVSMKMDVCMREPADDDLIATLASEGITDPRLVEIKDGQKFIIRKQAVSISFSGIDTSPDKSGSMPSWKDKLVLNGQNGEFEGKGPFREYEIIKTF